jgi:CHAT domain-containing protein
MPALPHVTEALRFARFRKAFAAFARAQCALLIAFAFSFPAEAHAAAMAGPQQKSAYALMLDSLAHDTPAAQIQRLQNFLSRHPEEERAYLKLLERYQLGQMLPEAKAFFNDWAKKQPRRGRTSAWMLAKIAACDTLRSALQEALAAFSQAMGDSMIPPSPRLVYDFIRFCHEHSDSLDQESLIHDHLPRSNDRVLALGFYLYLNEDFKHAEDALLRALRAERNSPLVLYILGECLLRNERMPLARRTARADSAARAGLLWSQQNHDAEWEARFSAFLGDLAFAKNAFDQAHDFYGKARNAAESSRDLYSLQMALGGFGKLYYIEGNYEAADSLYTEAIAIAASICAHRDVSLLYSNYCQLLSDLGDFPKALRAGTASERFALRAHDEEGLVRIRLKLGRLYHDLMQDQYAKQLCLPARAMAKKRGYAKMYHRAGALLADILAREKKFEEARGLYDEYLGYLKATGDKFERHSYFAKKADTYRDEGNSKKAGREPDYDKAILLYQQAAREAASANAEYYQAWYLLEIADLETQRGRLESAAEALGAIPASALGESKEVLIRFQLSWGVFYQKQKEWDRAIAAYREAAAMVDSTRPQLNLDYLRIGYFSARARAAQGLAECFFQRHRMGPATADRDSLRARKALLLTDDLQPDQVRQAGAAPDSLSYYDRLFHYMEMAKARSFHDLIAPRENARDHDQGDAGEERNYRRACAELQKLQRRLRTARTPEEYESLRSRLEAARYSVVYLRPEVRSSPRASQAPRSNGVYSFAEAQQVLQQHDAALLHYSVSADTPFVLVVSAAEARALTLPATRAQLVALCDSLMSPFHADTLRANTIPFHAGAAHRLYELLIKPVQEAVNLPKKLLVVPDAALANVPFEMLLTKAQPKSTYFPGDDATAYARDFLLHDYAFVYCPSFGLLKRNLRAASPPPGVLIFANPLQETINIPGGAKPGRRLAPLPFTELEAESIANLGARTAKYTRGEATQAAFFSEAQQYRIVHFATHAFVDSGFDAFSGLVLAPSADSTDDGLLMGYEIADSDRSIDLVTLSACETGLGNLAEGEGVLGLPRLFLRSGAKSVLMTLWQVDDQFAADLIPGFYDYLLNQGLAKAEALAEAKREFLRKDLSDGRGIHHQHPFYWAAFALYGDPGQNAERKVITPLILLIAGLVLLTTAVLFYFRRRARKAFSYEP